MIIYTTMTLSIELHVPDNDLSTNYDLSPELLTLPCSARPPPAHRSEPSGRIGTGSGSPARPEMA